MTGVVVVTVLRLCPICGRPRSRGGICRGCKRKNAKVRESDLRFWLRSCGIDPGLTPVREWCKVNGVPDELITLANLIWGDNPK